MDISCFHKEFPECFSISFKLFLMVKQLHFLKDPIITHETFMEQKTFG